MLSLINAGTPVSTACLAVLFALARATFGVVHGASPGAALLVFVGAGLGGLLLSWVGGEIYAAMTGGRVAVGTNHLLLIGTMLTLCSIVVALTEP